MSLRGSEATVAIAMPANNNEMLKQVQHDKVLCHYKASTTHDPCTYDQCLMCCPASGSAITTSNAVHSPRNDSKSFTKPVKHCVVALPPRNDRMFCAFSTIKKALGKAQKI